MNWDLIRSWTAWLLPQLADHLWQATLIGLITLLAAYLLSRQSARLRHALLLLALAKFFLPAPLLVSGLGHLSVTAGWFSSTSSATGVSYLRPSAWLEFDAQQTSAVTAKSSASRPVIYIASTSAWLLGVFFLTARWLRRRQLVRALLASAPRVAVGREAEAMRRVAGWMFLRRPVELALPSGFLEPGVWGMSRPVLLLPAEVSKEMNDAELESVILHELIHVERHDNLIAALQRSICYLFWFHPLVWILDRRLLLERERVCDELVLEMRIDRNVYAASIVKVTRFCLGGKLAGASCVTGADLKRRIDMILKTTILTRFTAWHWMLIGSSTCGLLILALVTEYPRQSLLTAQTLVVKEASSSLVSSPQSAMSFWPEEKYSSIEEKVKLAPEVSMNIENRPGCPLIIVNATMRWVEVLEETNGAASFAVLLRFELSNTTSRGVKSFVTSPFFPEREKLPSEGKIFMMLGQTIEPLGKLEVPMGLRPLRLAERPESLTIRVEGVEFQDGSSWGNTGRPPSNGQSVPGPSKVRVGGAVQSANLSSQVAPIYPPLARQARLQGDVVLDAEISREGDVTNLRVVSGHPLLIEAALTAARQWKYRPTLLNGQPVIVVSQITVPFRLDDAGN